MRRKSKKTKERLRMGTGSGASYKPYVQVAEFGSSGTAGRVVDWKNGRVVHLLSQVEIYFWYMIRWNDEVLDIREQFPLDLKETEKIADEFGINHPSNKGEHTVMTTDLFVTTTKGDVAFSIKRNKKFSERTLEKLFLEKQYWERRSIPWKLITVEDFNMTTARNIRDVVAFYNESFFPDKISFLKFLVARKFITIDLSKDLNWKEQINEHEDEIKRFENSVSEISLNDNHLSKEVKKNG